MSIVNISQLVSQGGPVKLNIKNGKGTSDEVQLQLKISVDPSDDVPDVEAKLTLPAGHFSFGGQQSKTVSLGKKGNGESVTIPFTVNCDTDDPASTMALTVAVQDEFDLPTTGQNLTYPVEKK